MNTNEIEHEEKSKQKKKKSRNKEKINRINLCCQIRRAIMRHSVMGHRIHNNHKNKRAGTPFCVSFFFINVHQ